MSNRMNKTSQSFKFDFSGATFSDFKEDGCKVTGFTVDAERYGMDSSIYGIPSGEVSYYIDDYEFRQGLIERYGPPYPEHGDEEYYGEDGMYSEELEEKFRKEAEDWERDMDRFESALDANRSVVDAVKLSKLTLRCKSDGAGAYETDDYKECKVKLHISVQVPDGPIESAWVSSEGNFFPSEDVIGFMESYVEELDEEGIDKMKKNTKIMKHGIDFGGRTYYVLDVAQMARALMNEYRRENDPERFGEIIDLLSTATEALDRADDITQGVAKDCGEKVEKHHFTICQFDIQRLIDNDEDYQKATRRMMYGEVPPDPDYYVTTYEYDDEDDNLEHVFHRFNVDHPDDFRSYSLSVGDIVIRDGTAYRVDDYGFSELPDFRMKKDDGESEEPAEPESDEETVAEETEPVKEKPAEPPSKAEEPREEGQATADTENVDKARKGRKTARNGVAMSPSQMLEACMKAQTEQKRNGLMFDEICKIVGPSSDPEQMFKMYQKRGMIRKIRCAEGMMYRFSDAGMRRA